MISMIQVHFIELHWEAIARRALARIREEVPHSHTLPDAVILQRVSDLFGHLGDWLAAGDPDGIAARYEQLGRERTERHHLCDLVRCFQIIRQCAVDYARDHQLNENTALSRNPTRLKRAWIP